MIHYATILERVDDGYRVSCGKCGDTFEVGPMWPYTCSCGLRWSLDVSVVADDGIEDDEDETT